MCRDSCASTSEAFANIATTSRTAWFGMGLGRPAARCAVGDGGHVQIEGAGKSDSTFGRVIVHQLLHLESCSPTVNAGQHNAEPIQYRLDCLALGLLHVTYC